VHVLEDEECGLCMAQALEETSCGEEEQLTDPGFVVGGEAEQKREVARCIRRLVLGDDLSDGALKLLAGDLRWIRRDDPGRLSRQERERLVAGLAAVR